MPENQTPQNFQWQNVQNPVVWFQQAPVQPTEQVQQPVTVQNSQPVQNVQQPVNPDNSAQIQQLLIQQQQYQQQYNQLVNYVKQTPNLPLDQVNQIKQQLDQLNALFVEWKQKLLSLWYNSVQVNKPTEVKKWSKNNFSLKKLVIWCWIIMVLMFVGFWIMVYSLIQNPDALEGINISADMAKMILMLFVWLIFWSAILLMLGLVIANIYRLITLKNQTKRRSIVWLIGWVVWMAFFWWIMWLLFMFINRIQKIVVEVNYPAANPFLVSTIQDLSKENIEFVRSYTPLYNEWRYNDNLKLIAPSEISFMLRWKDLENLTVKTKQLPKDIIYKEITLSCWNSQKQILELDWDVDILNKENRYAQIPFKWTCLYWQKWEYSYVLNVKYKLNNVAAMEKTYSAEAWKLKFKSEFKIYVSENSKGKMSQVLPKNWEFLLWKAPAKITIATDWVFRDFGLNDYKIKWDMDWDWENDRENQVSFNYSYRIPRVYYPRLSFEDLWSTVYSFPVRVEQSNVPVCWIELEKYQSTTKYKIRTEFADASSASIISMYSYKIVNASTDKVIEQLDNDSQERNYEFPEKWNYKVVLDYSTIDWKQWWCESDVVQMKKETFDVRYTLMIKWDDWKYKELCSSNGSEFSKCTVISSDQLSKQYLLQIKSITPVSNTVTKAVYLDDVALLNDNDTFEFGLNKEWTFVLKIVVSDVARWMQQEERFITFTVKKPDIVGKISIISADTREPVDEWFEPLSVILDASKTDVNIPWDEIVYFTWDFGDGQKSQNQQNGIIAHTYRYDYARENWIFAPKVIVQTRKWYKKEISADIRLNVKKELLSVELSSPSHPTRQSKIWNSVTFQSDFDWLPKKMVWDFGDWSEPTECPGRTCTEVLHTFKSAWSYSVKLTLEFDAVQKSESVMEFKAYE